MLIQITITTLFLLTFGSAFVGALALAALMVLTNRRKKA